MSERGLPRNLANVLPWMLALIPGVAQAHDGDLSLVLFGPVSFLVSLLATNLLRPSWPLRLLVLFGWLLLVTLVYGVIQVPLQAVYVPPGPEADEIFKTLAIFYLAVVPVVLVILLFFARKLIGWLNT